MTQTELFAPPVKPCALCTVSVYAEDRKTKIFHASCACGWKSPEFPTALPAARLWMEHAAQLRNAGPENNG